MKWAYVKLGVLSTALNKLKDIAVRILNVYLFYLFI
jgi:hypothetical protein